MLTVSLKYQIYGEISPKTNKVLIRVMSVRIRQWVNHGRKNTQVSALCLIQNAQYSTFKMERNPFFVSIIQYKIYMECTHSEILYQGK